METNVTLLDAADKFFQEVMAIHGDDAADPRTIEAMRGALLQAKASQPPVLVEEVCKVTSVREHKWGVGFDAESDKGNMKLQAYLSGERVDAGDEVRVSVRKA